MVVSCSVVTFFDNILRGCIPVCGRFQFKCIVSKYYDNYIFHLRVQLFELDYLKFYVLGKDTFKDDFLLFIASGEYSKSFGKASLSDQK